MLPRPWLNPAIDRRRLNGDHVRRGRIRHRLTQYRREKRQQWWKKGQECEREWERERMKGKKSNRGMRKGTQIKRTSTYAVELIHMIGIHLLRPFLISTPSFSFPRTPRFLPSLSPKARVGLTPGKSNIVAAGYRGNLVTPTCWHSTYVARVYRMRQKSRAI